MARSDETNSTTTGRSSAPGCVRGLTLTFVSLFVILSAIVAIAWLVLKPHQPGFRVSSLSVSNFTVSDSQLGVGGRYVVELNITNPNKKIQVVLDRFHVSVCYGQVVLSTSAGAAAVPQPIYLEKMGHKDLKVKLMAVAPKLVHKKVVSPCQSQSQSRSQDQDQLVKDWNEGMVKLNVKMQVRTRLESGILPTREKILNVCCGDLNVGSSPTKHNGMATAEKGCLGVNY